MRRGSRAKALWIAATLPLLAASVLPTQFSTLVCRFTGAVMDVEACCPGRDVDQAPVRAQLLDETCCIVRTVDLGKLVSDRSLDGAPPRIEALIALSLGPPPFLPPRHVRRVRPVGPPPVGPPLILVKSSFLI